MNSTANHPPSDDVMIALKTIVERAVRPVAASRARKRAMREELLAHVTDVFDDELARLADAATALARTRERFGQPAELTSELQRTVPIGDRMAAWLDRLGWSPGEPLWRLAVRHLVLAVCVFAVMCLILLPGVYLNSAKWPSGLAMRISLSQALVVGPFAFLFATIAPLLGQKTFGATNERSWRGAVICLAAAAMLIPALAFFNYWLLTGDLANSIRHLLLAILFLPVYALLFVVIGRMAYKELAYEQEWGSLELNE